jgi:hypothetical protein
MQLIAWEADFLCVGGESVHAGEVTAVGELVAEDGLAE